MVLNWLCACGLLAIVVGVIPDDAKAQSTSATMFGTVSDEHQAVVAGAAITLTSLDTGETRTTTSGGRGTYRIIGLSPGRYELRVVLRPFADQVRSNLVLGLSEEAAVDVTMRTGCRERQRDGDGRGANRWHAAHDPGTGIHHSGDRGIARRRAATSRASPFCRQESARWPAAMRTNATGITSAGQNGRNNTFLIDGLSIDDNRQSNIRGTPVARSHQGVHGAVEQLQRGVRPGVRRDHQRADAIRSEPELAGVRSTTTATTPGMRRRAAARLVSPPETKSRLAAAGRRRLRRRSRSVAIARSFSARSSRPIATPSSS